MTRPAWDTLTPEQQRDEWERFQAWQAMQVQPQPQRAPAAVPPKSTDRWPWVAGGALTFIVVLVVAVVAGAVSNAGTTIRGDVSVLGNTNASYYSSGGACSTYGGYSDIAQGTSVTVRDASDAIVGMGTLSAGQSNSGSCVFTFSVAEVPKSDYYTVEVSKRGPLTYSYDAASRGEVHQSLSSY